MEGSDGEDEGHEAISARLQELVEELPSLGELLAAGRAPTELIREYFAELDPSFIGSHGVGFYCDCNRERFKRFISALPNDDLQDVMQNGPFPLRITCHNCSSDYFFDRDEIAALSEG
jgi:molecular chaperone Hsp33